MKTMFLLGLLILAAFSFSFAVTHTITNSGTTFTPSTLSINLGDTVIFSLASIHNAIEVSQSIWNTNGNTSNGGFILGFGGGVVVLQSTGTHYYVCGPHASLGMKGTITVNPTTDVNASPKITTTEFELDQNYPNPFNPSTVINFSLSKNDKITLKIYDILGTEVATLINQNMISGSYSAEWNASNLPSGIYFYQLKSATNVESNRMMLTK